jgi:hypothetical protein
MSLAFFVFAFLATGADGEIRNLKRAEARAADANPHHQCSFFLPLAPNFIFKSDVHDDDDEYVTDIKKGRRECVCSGISRNCKKFWPQNNHGGGHLQKADVRGNTTLK